MAKKKDKDEECCTTDFCSGNKNQYVAIPSALAGIYMVILVLFLIFAREQLEYAVAILWGFVTLGIVALILSYKSDKNKTK